MLRDAQLVSRRVRQSGPRARLPNPAQLGLTLLIFQMGKLRLREVTSLEEGEARI